MLSIPQLDYTIFSVFFPFDRDLVARGALPSRSLARLAEQCKD